jgi:dipeptidyl aminopeptidase/acylaminoacyl peptidase
VRGPAKRAALALALAAGATAALAKPHTVEELRRPPVVRDAALSRDGKQLALVGQFGGDREYVVILDAGRIDDPSATRKFAIGQEGVHKPLWVMWANDHRLLVAMQVGTDAWPYLVSGRQVQAIDVDGGRPVTLFADTPIGARFGLNLSQVVDVTPDDPDHIVMAAWNRDRTDLFQVDVNTGTATPIARGRSNTVGWETEDGAPALRYDVNRRGTEMTIYGRDAEDPEDWSRITKIRIREVIREWEFAGDAPGAGRIYVRARHGVADTQNIVEFDLRTRGMGAVVAEVPGFDMDEAFAIDGSYAGATYVGDTIMYLLNDARLQVHWNAVRRYFKEGANVRILEVDRDRKRMLLFVDGPRAPGDFYLYDVDRAKLEFIASDRPWIEPDKLAEVEVLKSPMRDGTTITSYLTKPAGDGPMPLVVMPHGGPEVRDSIGFDPEAQAFAAQGWLVLQPNFRGSGGYGHKFAEAGYRQWAKRMQDDVTDAVQDLVRRGVADPKRIAIHGTSYGGYAALMGAVVTPDLYCAAVSRAGPGDLPAMMDYVRHEDGPDSENYRYWLASMGDPKADGAALEAASPRLRAAEIRVPVLLLHGADDEIVPPAQSREMKKALEKAGKSVRYIEYAGQAHGGWDSGSETRQIEDSIAFLKPFLDEPPNEAP